MARITNEQQIPISILPLTATGKPAVIDGDAVFESSDPLVATVTSTGPLSAMVVAVGLGVAQITVSVDADLDEGEVRTLTGSDVVEVVGAEAESFTITFGAPEPIPAP